MFLLEKHIAGVRLPQGKLEGRKQFQIQENNLDYVNVLGWVSPIKETTANAKERSNLLVEVNAKTNYRLRTNKSGNMRRSVKMEHCFKIKETYETTRRTKMPRWHLCTFKDRKRNYMERKIYLKQQLLKDIFTVKRYGKGLLFQIIE